MYTVNYLFMHTRDVDNIIDYCHQHDISQYDLTTPNCLYHVLDPLPNQEKYITYIQLQYPDSLTYRETL